MYIYIYIYTYIYREREREREKLDTRKQPKFLIAVHKILNVIWKNIHESGAPKFSLHLGAA